MAEDDPNDMLLLIHMLEVNLENMVFRLEAFSLQLIEFRMRLDRLESWQRQMQEGWDMDTFQHAILGTAGNAEETFEDSARRKGDSVHGPTEVTVQIPDIADIVEAIENVQQLLSDVKRFGRESKADVEDSSLQEFKKQRRHPEDFIHVVAKSEHLPMNEKELEGEDQKEKEGTQLRLLELADMIENLSKGTKPFRPGSEQLDHHSMQGADGREEKQNDTDEPKEPRDEFEEKVCESTRKHEDNAQASEGLVPKDNEFELQKNEPTKVHQPPEVVDDIGDKMRRTVHFEGGDDSKRDLPEEAMGPVLGDTPDSEDFVTEFDLGAMEEFSGSLKMNTSDELEKRFCESARVQEELIQSTINEVLKLIIISVEKETNANLPDDLRKYLHECVRNLIDSTQMGMKLRVHELESDLFIKTNSVRGLRAEIVRLYKQLSRKFWKEISFKERLYELREALNDEVLLRQRYESLNLEYARAYDDVTLNVEKEMKLHRQMTQDFKDLRSNYEKLKREYDSIARIDKREEDSRDTRVPETNESKKADELRPSVVDLQLVLLLQSLKKLKETIVYPSAARKVEQKLKPNMVQRPGGLNYCRRKIAEYVDMEPALRCERLEKILAANKQRHVSVGCII
jgi:hypothetical protein